MRTDKFTKKTTHFIETGSHKGDGIELALQSGFEVIYSIELDLNYFKLCNEKFKNNPNVHIILGDSYYELEKLISFYKDTPFTYWLDGHYCGEGSGFGVKETPLMKELEVILTRKNIKDELIYVDDMRLYRNFDNEVNISNIEQLIKKWKPDCKTWYEPTIHDSSDILCIEY